MLGLFKWRLRLIPREQLKAGNIILIQLPADTSKELQRTIGETANKLFSPTNVRVVLAPANVKLTVLEKQDE